MSGTPDATEAFQIRAPSQCSAMPCRWVSSRSACRSASGCTSPPARLWVCSTLTALVATVPHPAGRRYGSTTSAVSRPPGAVRDWIPPCAAAAPCSYVTTCASASHTSSEAGGTSSCRQIWLPIVPLGTNTAASCPNSSATRSSRALTDGSSP